MDDPVATIRKHIHPALANYLSSVTFKTTGLFGTVFWILSSIFSSTLLQVAAVSIYIIPAVAYYFRFRPFGIEISYTPTVEKDGELTADKVAEERGEAHLRNGECVITFLVDISDYKDDFDLEFRTTDEICVELRDIPLEEHSFNRDPLALSATNITARRFQLVTDVFLAQGTTAPTSEYPLKVVDASSGRCIRDIKLVAR